MRAYLTPRRVDDIFHLLPIFRLGKMVPYIQFLRLLGRLTAASALRLLPAVAAPHANVAEQPSLGRQ
ncbi:hypothetical protein F7725_001709, partial [Dissostichus mawsoni]